MHHPVAFNNHHAMHYTPLVASMAMGDQASMTAADQASVAMGDQASMTMSDQASMMAVDQASCAQVAEAFAQPAAQLAMPAAQPPMPAAQPPMSFPTAAPVAAPAPPPAPIPPALLAAIGTCYSQGWGDACAQAIGRLRCSDLDLQALASSGYISPSELNEACTALKDFSAIATSPANVDSTRQVYDWTMTTALPCIQDYCGSRGVTGINSAAIREAVTQIVCPTSTQIPWYWWVIGGLFVVFLVALIAGAVGYASCRHEHVGVVVAPRV